MSVICGIYKIENLVNHKVYIGQSVNIKRRFQEHIKRSVNNFKGNRDYKSMISDAIRKYGKENFKLTIIEECQREELNDREIFWILYFESNNPKKGYNLTIGGESNITYSVLSEKQVNEIKDLLKNTNISQQNIAKQFQISQNNVSLINRGVLWGNSFENYPIRKSIKIEKRKNYCKICKSETKGYSDICYKCAVMLQRKVNRPNKEELKKEIRENSFLCLSEKYGVTDNAIRKWCKSYNLPFRQKEIKRFTDEEWLQL